MKIVDTGQYAQFDKYTDRNIFEQYYKKNEQGGYKMQCPYFKKVNFHRIEQRLDIE